jgi:hypothetical protein
MKTKAKNNSASTKKQHKKKIVLTTLAVSAAGILGYFGWQYFKKQRDKKSGNIDEILKPTNTPIEPYHAPVIDTPIWTKPKIKPKPKQKPVVVDIPNYEDIPKASDGFPLKRGSKGDKVKALQEALIEKFGKTIMPRYGADGFFGAEMVAALRKLKLPASISETTYNVLVQGHVSTKTTSAQKLYEAATKSDFKTALALLKTIKSKDDYQAVGNEFKNYRINGVRQTLVNGMLNSFTKDEQKQAIRFEFIRMGLQYDGNKWSLSGLGGLPVITTEETTVWLNANNGVKVPNRMVLGNEVSRKLDYTLFENNGKYFLVQSKYIKYL